jgi:hypothetical protein
VKPETKIRVAKVAIPVLVALAIISAVLGNWVMVIGFVALAVSQALILRSSLGS